MSLEKSFKNGAHGRVSTAGVPGKLEAVVPEPLRSVRGETPRWHRQLCCATFPDELSPEQAAKTQINTPGVLWGRSQYLPWNRDSAGPHKSPVNGSCRGDTLQWFL